MPLEEGNGRSLIYKLLRGLLRLVYLQHAKFAAVRAKTRVVPPEKKEKNRVMRLRGCS